jgi:glutathione synthase/RimK-type ligase-like ATP-grasp enzyme
MYMARPQFGQVTSPGRSGKVTMVGQSLHRDANIRSIIAPYQVDNLRLVWDTTPDIVLVTAAEMPKADTESALVVAALATRGVTAEVRPWDGDTDWSEIPLVVCRSPWDYFERAEAFLRWVDEAGATTHLENPAAVLRWNSHKSYLLDLAQAGVPIVPTALIRRGAGDHTLLAALAGHNEVVIKPAVSVGAIGALRARADDPAGIRHLRRLAVDGDVLVQPFIETVVHRGEISVVCFDGQPSHAVHKRPADGDYRVQDHHGGTVQPHSASDAELAVAGRALAAGPEATAYARIDLVDGADGPCVMELELIEPELFLGVDDHAAGRFADCLTERLRRAKTRRGTVEP